MPAATIKKKATCVVVSISIPGNGCACPYKLKAFCATIKAQEVKYGSRAGTIALIFLALTRPPTQKAAEGDRREKVKLGTKEKTAGQKNKQNREISRMQEPKKGSPLWRRTLFIPDKTIKDYYKENFN